MTISSLLNSLDSRLLQAEQALANIKLRGRHKVARLRTSQDSPSAQAKGKIHINPLPDIAQTHHERLLLAEADMNRKSALDDLSKACADLLGALMNTPASHAMGAKMGIHLYITPTGTQITPPILLSGEQSPVMSVPYSSGVLHRAARLLPSITGLAQGHNWRVEIQESDGLVSSSISVQAQTPQAAIAWAMLEDYRLLYDNTLSLTLTEIHDSGPDILGHLRRQMVETP